MNTDAHPRRQEVPQIPLAQENSFAMVLAAIDRSAARVRTRTNSVPALKIIPLKVGADIDRPCLSRRAGEKSFRTPEKQIMAYAPTLLALMAGAGTFVVIGLKTSPGPQAIGTNLPCEAGHGEKCQSFTNASGSRVIQSLAS